MNIKSNLDNKLSIIPILKLGDLLVKYSPYIGFAAASTEHLAFKLVCIPALDIVTVYYSITSCIATLSI